MGWLDVLELDASQQDLEVVAQQLGRKPQGKFRVVVREADGTPAVIQNAPRLFDGTPMPTLYWLTSADLIRRIGHLESAGGVNRAEAEVDEEKLNAAHQRYAKERDELLNELEGESTAPKPYGGVAGTRKGVKCLHAHYAYYLAGGNDPVGEWVGRKLRDESGHPSS